MSLIRCNNRAFARGLHPSGRSWRGSELHVDRPESGAWRHLPGRVWRTPMIHFDPSRVIEKPETSEQEIDEQEEAHASTKDETAAAIAKRSRAKRRYVLGPLVFLAVIASVLWVLRYPIIENYARNKLAAQGIEADLSLSLLSKDRAVIKDIRLASEAGMFLTAQNVDVTYDWRDALKLKLRRVSVEKPDLTLKVNAQGDIINGWMPESRGSKTSTFVFPQDGIEISGGKITLESPYGDYEAAIDAQTRSEKDMTATITAEPQKVSHEMFNAVVGGQITANLLGDRITYEADLTIPQFSYDQFSGSGLSAKWQADTTRETITQNLTSTIEARFDHLSSTDVMARGGVLIWDGTLNLPQNGTSLPAAIGAWTASIDQAGITNTERRERLAKSVTLSDTLLNISASAPFSPGLTNAVDTLLRENKIEASGHLEVNDQTATISLGAPALIIGEKNSLRLDPLEEQSFFEYDKLDQSLTVSFDGKLDGPYAASLNGAELVAKIKDGRHFSNIQSFKARLKTQQTWRALTQDRRPVRLAPLTVNVAYDATEPTRKIRLAGAVNYDGDVPGGYAQGLRTRGVLNLNLIGENLSAKFTQNGNTGIKISRLETTSDWVIHDADFSLSAHTPQYKRTNGRGQIKAIILGGEGRIVHRINPQNMAFQLGRADVKGIITNTQQDWDITATDTHMTSDTFPSAGTDITAKNAHIMATLKPGHPVSFAVDSPSANIKTQLVNATNMSVSASGTPGDLSVRYGYETSQGLSQVKFSAGELPVLPLQGDVAFFESAWTGTATTTLPKSNATPININYTFKNGVGSANVDIDDLPFSPSQLQPQHLISALSGKISRVEGQVSTRINLSFGTDRPLTSSGTATIKNMSAGTLPGPFSGLNGDLTFSSFFPLQTNGMQTVTLRKFDPGFPLENGTMQFEIIPDGVKIQAAQWPLASGQISLDPTTWLYSAAQNTVRLKIDNVSLGEFLKNVGGGKLTATGDVSGVLPVLIEGIKVHVKDGRLMVQDGGVIEYTSPQTEAAGDANEYAGYAFQALKHFEYDELEATIDGPLDGPMKLRMKFGGSNPDVLYGTEFKFNVGVEGELLNILRSFKMGDSINAKIIEDLQARQTGTQPEP